MHAAIRIAMYAPTQAGQEVRVVEGGAGRGNSVAGGDGRLSRRDLLAGAGGLLAGGAIGSGITIVVTDGDGTVVSTNGNGAASAAAPLQSFTVQEVETVEAVVARLIPADDDGPSGDEAGVARYIDRALAGDLRDARGTYQEGLRALDAAAEDMEGGRFAALEPEQQDRVLQAFAEGELDNDGDTGTIPEGALPTPSGFFATVHEHALQGMFGDPAYGGNVDFAGWELLGYPGVKMSVPSEDQELDVDVDAARRSAYSYEEFAREADEGGNDG